MKSNFSSGWKTVIIAGVAAAIVTVSGPSLAIEPSDGPTYYPTPEGEVKAYSESQIAAALKEGVEREAAGNQTAEEDALEDQLIASSAEEGTPLVDEDIATLKLDSNITAAVAETTTLEKVEIVGDTLQDGAVEAVSVAAGARANEDTAISTTGSGMGSWGSRVDGQYVLTTKNPNPVYGGQVIGTGTFLWARERALNDGSGTYDWWKYSRKGIGQAKDVAGDNWQIAKLRVQSFPYDSIEPGLVNWSDMEPAADFPGRCGSSISTSVSIPFFGAGYSFTPCDQYYVWHNPTNPGSYHITMDQGSYVVEGVRAAAYTVTWKSKQGNGGSQHDFQRILWRHTPGGSDVTCSSTDTSKVCSGW